MGCTSYCIEGGEMGGSILSNLKYTFLSFIWLTGMTWFWNITNQDLVEYEGLEFITVSLGWIASIVCCTFLVIFRKKQKNITWYLAFVLNGLIVIWPLVFLLIVIIGTI